MIRMLSKTIASKSYFRFSKILALSLIVLCLASLLAMPAFANVPDHVTLAVTQDFTNTGAATPPFQSFTYWLTADDESFPMPSGSLNGIYAFEIAGIGVNTVNLPPITFDTVGTYSYTLSCVNSSAAGYNYDRQIYTIEIYVYSDIPTFVIVTDLNGDKSDELSFSHRYGAGNDPDVMVDPPVSKTVQGNPDTDAMFTFKLQAEDPSFPMPEGSANGVKLMSIIGPGSVEFGTWSYIQPGTYRYAISEVNNGIAGYTYDTEVYTITDVVTLEDGHFIVDRTITNKAGSPTSVCSYNNIYEPVSEMITISGVKIWEHGNLDPLLHPASITIILKANGATLTQSVITANDNWSWSFTVDKYDADGNEIVYTIDEIKIHGYTKEIDGFNVKNIFNPDEWDPVTPPPTAPSGPQTGDDSSTALYSFLFHAAGVIALLSIWYLIVNLRRKKEAE